MIATTGSRAIELYRGTQFVGSIIALAIGILLLQHCTYHNKERAFIEDKAEVFACHRA